jgi:two-component system, response regulator YesN
MRYRVLVADDEELERRALRLILGGEGMPELEIIEAANGREALALVGEGELDAAFLDIKMPGIDGIEAARLLREARPRLPIVFLTAHDSFEYARSALRLRVEDFLLKPASAEEVATALRRALAPAGGGGGGVAAEAKLEGAVAYVAQELRADLAAGLVDEDRFARYLGLSGVRGGVTAVVALKCEARGERGLGVLRALASLAEALLSPERGAALAGAGPEFALCALLGGAAEDEDELRARLELLASRAREELGAAVAAGAAASAAGGDTPTASALAQAALRAAALAGAGRPLILLALSSSGAAPRRAEGDPEAAGAGRRTAFRALELLDARHAEELSLESVAQELGVSPSHLSRLLGRYAGMGFADCLARLRVERAKAYLGSAGLSVKEASTMVGFRDPAYFARVFRRFEGESPAEFRARRGDGGE